MGAMEVAAVGWFLAPNISKLTNACYEYLGDQTRWQTGMKKELERLQENQPKIQAVVSAVSQAQKLDPDSALNKWIWQLRDAIDEADDVLDDFEYMKHEEQLLAKNLEKTKVSSFMSSINKSVERALENDPMLKRLEEVVHKLDKISAEVSNFRDLLKDAKQEQQVQQDKLQNYRETGSMPTNVLIGRGQDKEVIIQWLIRKLPNEEHQSHVSNIPNYNNISVLSIVGPGGNGKTALLQHVYEDEITKKFDIKMWVCISNNFNVKKVIADMYESLKMTKLTLESLEALQQSLKSEVKSKKFLLVLDNIWEEDEERDKSKWETVFAPLAYGDLGSKILLTTRMSSAALMIASVIKRKNEVLKLEGLKEDECLQLLSAHAFVNVENPNEHNKLRSIAGELVTKLYGSPLAAKVLGGVLNSKLDERHWRNVLNNVLVQNSISSILELSYIFLPKYLQNCFAFCSIFAQDHIFDKDDLIRMWIAVGFIQSSYIHEETLEDIGERYFDILVKKSLFDELRESKYTMHALLHELAKKISSHECFRVSSQEDSERIPKTIRYLSIETDNIELLKKFRKFKNLRTLCITTNDRDNQDLDDVLTEFFEENRSIRLLSIHAYYHKMIPEEIECLKHLRYLKLDFYVDTLLPRSVSKIYHLQFLICDYSASHDKFFPRDMNNLSNLRYLSCPHLKFPGIGKLKFLQELNVFEVKNESGYRIEELEHMNDLRILRIKGLENVTDVQKACNAKICDKRELTDLYLEWKATSHNSADLGIYARVIDNLQPHNNLKKLTMNGYMGVRPAIWMNKANNSISNLENIELVGSLEWKNLPPFGQLPFLKSLELRDMPKAEWFDNRVDSLFPCLTELRLYNCSNLQELPYLPPMLKELKANNIGWKTLNCCNILGPFGRFRVFGCPNISTIMMNWEIIGGPGVLNNVELKDCPNLLSIGGHQEVQTTENCLNLIVDELIISDASVLQMEPMRSITSIRTLTIEDNFDDGASSFPFEVERWFLQVSSSLPELYFSNLESLQSLPSYLTSLFSLETLNMKNLPQLNLLPSYLSTISSLKELHLRNIPLLKSLPELPPYLSKLFLNNLDNLNCLPSCLPSLSSLTALRIFKVPQLWELPDLSPSLIELLLNNLDNLNCLPSCLHRLSSLTKLGICNVPQLRELQDLPPSLRDLILEVLKNLNSLPSCLPSLSSLRFLHIREVRQLRELPDLPASLCTLTLEDLDNLNYLPSCLPSLSSLAWLAIINVPQLRELPDLPPSLSSLRLSNLDNLNCLPSCLRSHSSLTELIITSVPQLRELPDLPPFLSELLLKNLDNLNCLPSCFTSLSSLTKLRICNIPQLRELQDLPPSLCDLSLEGLDNLNSLPSCLPSLSSLTELDLRDIPQLRELPDLSPSLHVLNLDDLESLNSLPSCLPSLSSLTALHIYKVPQPRELPNLPPSLEVLDINECDPELMKRYKELSIFFLC